MLTRTFPETDSGSDSVTSKTRVLVCEDQGLTALRLKTALESFDCEVVGLASNGEEAVQMARQLQPDAILLDVNMPRLDGIRALHQIMEEQPVAVVMVTAYSDPELIQSALRAGASGYLVKPIRNEQLQPTLALALSTFSRRFRRPTSRDPAGEPHSVGGPLCERALLEEAEREVCGTRERLEALQRRYAEEHEIVRALSEACLTRVPSVPGLEIAARYEPASDFSVVGGDLIDFFEPRPAEIALVLADLCGHGLEAVAQLARAKYMLRAYALEATSPAEVAARLNQALCSQPDENCPFLTLFYGVLDLSSWRFQYCNAGHPPPLLCDGTGARLHELLPTGGIVGASEAMEFEDATILLPAGCVLTLYTDGVIEARSRIGMLGQEGLEALFIRDAHRQAADIADTILRETRHFAGGRLKDDVALVILKRSE